MKDNYLEYIRNEIITTEIKSNLVKDIKQQN